MYKVSIPKLIEIKEALEESNTSLIEVCSEQINDKMLNDLIQRLEKNKELIKFITERYSL